MKLVLGIIVVLGLIGMVGSAVWGSDVPTAPELLLIELPFEEVTSPGLFRPPIRYWA